jgi:hypothetical protein
MAQFVLLMMGIDIEIFDIDGLWLTVIVTVRPGVSGTGRNNREFSEQISTKLTHVSDAVSWKVNCGCH